MTRISNSFTPMITRAFAEAVGEKTAGHGKHDERQSEQRADDADEPVALFAGEAHAGDERDDEPLERVVAERALELRDDERPEAALAMADGGWRMADCQCSRRKVTNSHGKV